MRLDALLTGIEVVSCSRDNPDIARLTCVADEVDAATLFAACPFRWLAGRDDPRDAARRGAAAIMVDENVEKFPIPAGCPVIVVRRVARAYAAACANLFGNVHRQLHFYGVTGTKGKTTTCHLMESILRHAGVRVGLISTLVQRVARREIASRQTTPDAYQLHRTLAKMHAAGATHIVLEASSIGLAEDRLYGIRFDGVVLTNLGTDHLDYHGGFAEYRQAKRRLFTDPDLHNPESSVSVLNADDAFASELAADALGTVVTYGIERGGVRPTAFRWTGEGTRATVSRLQVESPLFGVHNLYNILGALALMEHELGDNGALASGVRQLERLPGRFESVAPSAPDPVDIFVDSAHTPESVLSVLKTAGVLAGGRRRIVVVGCGGGTDRGKRAPIARVALAHSDVCIVTTDNPRLEDPHAIIDDMLEGLPVNELIGAGRLQVIPNRREGIYRAVEAARDGGLVMLLGRGAEAMQVIGRRLLPFDDRQVARAALASLRSQPTDLETEHGIRPQPPLPQDSRGTRADAGDDADGDVAAAGRRTPHLASDDPREDEQELPRLPP